jgi:hypothetical protein
MQECRISTFLAKFRLLQKETIKTAQQFQIKLNSWSLPESECQARVLLSAEEDDSSFSPRVRVSRAELKSLRLKISNSVTEFQEQLDNWQQPLTPRERMARKKLIELSSQIMI